MIAAVNAMAGRCRPDPGRLSSVSRQRRSAEQMTCTDKLRSTVSVVMATCNGARLLQQQLDFIAAQSMLPEELIVGDDLSEDDSVQIIQEFARQSPRIDVRLEVNTKQGRRSTLVSLPTRTRWFITRTEARSSLHPLHRGPIRGGQARSVGNRGDSYDNALAEAINGLYKAELIRRRGPWKSRESAELATLEWVSWFNHQRSRELQGCIPPAEAEANYCRQPTTRSAMAA